MITVKRREKEKEKRKKTILRAAQLLLFKKGFKSVTVESIAKQAKLSKGAVYLYFKSKEEIYAQILLNDIEKFNKKVFDVVEIDGTATNMMFNFSDIYIDFFLNERELFRILMTFMLHTDDLNFSAEMNSQMIQETNRTIEVVDRILKQGFDTGEFSCKNDIIKVRNVVWGLLNGIISLHLFTGKEITREVRIRSHISEGLKVFIEGLKQSHNNPDDSGR
ncbi:MAG: TetR/AcrR family transcriptional regulator [Deltaproteobacteria bacterium]|nr:TetR/AcrR family transcriptional regulator [Deltaproteobacteria bacterium]